MKVTLLYLRDEVNPESYITNCPLSKLSKEDGRYASKCGAIWVKIQSLISFPIDGLPTVPTIFRYIDVSTLPNLEPGEIIEITVDISVINYNYVDYEENSNNK